MRPVCEDLLTIPDEPTESIDIVRKAQSDRLEDRRSGESADRDQARPTCRYPLPRKDDQSHTFACFLFIVDAKQPRYSSEIAFSPVPNHIQREVLPRYLATRG
jgi:hypothetical protein